VQYHTSFSHRARPLLLLLAGTTLAHAQFDLEESHTTASLRGIHSVGEGVAWASGTDGTVLRTLDGGALWQPCTTPPGAEKLDFRGIQAFDRNTAIIMSSGKGDLSRLYKTTDACRTWHLVFTNPDKEGFFDALRRVTSKQLFLLGDPVDKKFSMFLSGDAGSTWFIADDPGLDAQKGDGAFASSNSSLTAQGPFLYFVTGGGASAHLYNTAVKCDPTKPNLPCPVAWTRSDLPLATGTPTSGAFSVAGRMDTNLSGKSHSIFVAVGGAYDKPEMSVSTSAFSTDSGGQHFQPAMIPPHGYRSSVVYNPTTNVWITVGPNGTDISRDDGRNWTPLKPAANQPPDTDKNWNALSLPFVVGPHGRIGKLRDDALVPAKP